MKKCLIVVDYQIDFVTGSLGFEGAKKIENNIIKKINNCRNDKYKIIFTLDTHNDDYLNTKEGKHLPVVHCIKNTQGHKLYGRVKECVSAKDKIIQKSAFGSDELFLYLKDNKFDLIELCGVVTDICVISNAILAKTACPEAEIIIDVTCCASNDKDKENVSLQAMSNLQMQIINKRG